MSCFVLFMVQNRGKYNDAVQANRAEDHTQSGMK